MGMKILKCPHLLYKVLQFKYIATKHLAQYSAKS